jgi:Tfp pilus assembly protein PilF
MKRLSAMLLLVAVVAAPQLAHTIPHPSIALEAEAEYQSAKEKIKAQDFIGAHRHLTTLLGDYSNQAEVYSLLGFTLRKTGRFEEALQHYTRALSLDARHLGANEYLGELHVELGQLDLARERLRFLHSVCGQDCEEARDLAAVIAAAEASSGRKLPP